MMSKKNYSIPEMKVMQVRSEERFTAVCGTTDLAGNNETTIGIDCVITRGPVYIPLNS